VWRRPGIFRVQLFEASQMLERSRFFRRLPRIAAWASLGAIAFVAGAVEPAEANKIKQSVIKIDAVEYTGTINSDVFRIYLNNTNFDPKTVNQLASSVEITRKGVKGTITVPIQDIAAPQPKKRGQNTEAKDGFIQWGASGSGDFHPGDKISLTLTFEGEVKYRSNVSQFSVINPKNNNPDNVMSAGILGSTATYDPSVAIFDDLDPAFYADTHLTVEKIGFMGELTTSQFEALNLDEIAAGTLPSGATLGSPSTFGLASSLVDSSPSAYSQTFDNPFPEPRSNLWDVVLAQVYDPNSNSTFALIDGSQAAPEPATWALMGSGFVVLGVTAMRRRRARLRG
jgi:PEP-CTERM motif-containing protein